MIGTETNPVYLHLRKLGVLLLQVYTDELTVVVSMAVYSFAMRMHHVIITNSWLCYGPVMELYRKG